MSALRPTSTAPLRGWARWLVIRGDALTLAAVAGLAGVVLIALATMGRASVLWGAAGVLLAVLGGVGVRWSRRAWRALLAEVASRFATHDVGAVPVPWLSQGVWEAANRYDPVLDGPMVLLAEVDPSLTVFPHDARGAFVRPTLRLVTREERDATPAEPVEPTEGAALSSEVILAELVATPGRQITPEPLWPVCCGRAAMLVSVRPEARPAGARWLPAHATGEADPDAAEQRGLHGYSCRTCGRAYATDPVW